MSSRKRETKRNLSRLKNPSVVMLTKKKTKKKVKATMRKKMKRKRKKKKTTSLLLPWVTIVQCTKMN